MNRLVSSWSLNLKGMDKSERVIIALLLCYIVLFFVGVVFAERSRVFDDSYITYRYANNLAQGYGITWNPGEQPVEGYTNFLLVITLAPFIKLGLSPLWVTRILSLAAALLISLLLMNVSKREYGATGVNAWLGSAAFLLGTKTAWLSMIGLETVIYTGALSVAFLTGSRYLNTRKESFILLFGFLVFAASLLRPEALMLAVPFAMVVLFSTWRVDELSWKSTLRLLGALMLALGFPLLVYLLWKYQHFGSVIPNPFYVKVANLESGLLVKTGLKSIRIFWNDHFLLVIAAILSFAVMKNHGAERAFAVLTGLLYFAFFARVDTLMDIYGRFLYPMTFILVYLSIPTLIYVSQRVLSMQWPNLIKIMVLLTLFMFLGQFKIYHTARNLSSIFHGEDRYASSNDLMQKEYEVAQALKQYPGIERVRIAFGDAGVVPYFTGALHLDVVGLNDRFIARERNIARLTDYFFRQQPDLILHPANKDNSWITYGHGPLGNYAKWSDDNRWDEYDYVGTVKPGTMYDIHLFVRRDIAEFDKLKAFLLDSVVDGYYDIFPIALGTYLPDRATTPVWISRPDA